MVTGPTLPTPGQLGLDQEQYNNARIIVAVGRAMGLSQRDIEIGEMTALDESGLHNYANANNPESLRYPHSAVGSDHGSVGIFQQQVGGAPNSTANWGTTAELMDPATAARKFFAALLNIGNRLAMNPWNVGQAVQGSAFSDGSNYQQQWQRGQMIADALYAGTPAGTIPTPGGANAASLSPLPPTPGLTPEERARLQKAWDEAGGKVRGAAGDFVSGVMNDVRKVAIYALFVAGGIGLVIVGLKRAADPATS